MIVDPFSELPLAIFTSCVALSIGTFIGLAIAVLKGSADEDALKNAGKWFIAPVVILGVGLIASFFHLKSPQYAIFALSGLPDSPLSREILTACIVGLYYLVTCVLAIMQKVKGSALKALLCVGILLGLILAVITGMAYAVATIPVWSSPFGALSMVGFSLLAVPLALCLMLLGGAQQAIDVKKAIAIVAIVGFVVGIGSSWMMVAQTAGMQTAMASGADLAAAAAPYMVVSTILGLLAAAGSFIAIKKDDAKGLIAICAGAAVIAIFLARIAFYCLQLNIGF